MSYIDNTRRNFSCPVEMTVCLTREECKILLPFFRKQYNTVKDRYEKYEDIHNGGEATERSENLRQKYLEQSESLESVLSNMEFLIK